MTPAYDPEDHRPNAMDRWDRLAEGLRDGGVEGFVEAYGTPNVPEKWLETIDRVLHQRLAAHEHPEALADALQAVPRSRPFEAWGELRAIDAPTVVVASRDEVDPEHPYATGERYAEAIPGARLVSEEPGASPLAWQGAQVSQGDQRAGGRLRQPRHEQQRALDHQLAVVGRREAATRRPRWRATKQAPKPGPERDLGPRVLQRARLEHADEAERVAQRLVARAAACAPSGAASSIPVGPSADACAESIAAARSASSSGPRVGRFQFVTRW